MYVVSCFFCSFFIGMRHNSSDARTSAREGQRRHRDGAEGKKSNVIKPSFFKQKIK